MASDYVREHPDYVRGVLEDSIAKCSTFCHYCGTEEVNKEGCHTRCSRCGSVSEGCGD